MAEVNTTVKSSGGDYTSLISWESGEQTDLVTDGDTHVVTCDPFEDDLGTSGLRVDGWTTDSTHFITIQGTDSPVFPWNASSAHTIRSSKTTVGPLFDVNEDYTVVNNIQLFLDSSADAKVVYLNAVGLDFDSVFARHDATGSSSGIVWANLGTGCVVKNSIVWITNELDVQGFYRSSADDEFDNCLAISVPSSTSQGFSYIDTVKNCVSYGFDTDYENFNTATTCATDLTEANSGLSGASHEYGITDNWIDSANGDFSFSSFPALENNGTNLYADFTTDILGTSRSSSGDWEIGPYANIAEITSSFTLATELLLSVETQGSLGTEASVEVVDVVGLGGEHLCDVSTEPFGLGTEALARRVLKGGLATDTLLSIEASRGLGVEALRSVDVSCGAVLLLESGDLLLTESGGHLLLEYVCPEIGAETLVRKVFSQGFGCVFEIDAHGIVRYTPAMLGGENRGWKAVLMPDTRYSVGMLEGDSRE